MRYDCLIIDDEKLLADSTAEYFNLFGVKTAAVYSVSGCRKFLRKDTASLLLLDINLGDGSGFKLCQELREETEIPILFMTIRLSRFTSEGTIMFRSHIPLAFCLPGYRRC